MKKNIVYAFILIACFASLGFAVHKSTHCPLPDDLLEDTLACDSEEHETCPHYHKTGNYMFVHKDHCVVLTPAEYDAIIQLLMPRKHSGSNALLKDILHEEEDVLSHKMNRLPEEIKPLKSNVKVLKAIVHIAPTTTVGSFLDNLKEEYK